MDTRNKMSSVVRRGSSRRKHRTSNDETAGWTHGQSFNAVSSLPHRKTSFNSENNEGTTESDQIDTTLAPPLAAQSFISKLPRAVTDVDQDVRSYVHSKRVTSYLIGSLLGEGSFAKVKEGFHVLVGEKVAVKVIDKKKALQDSYVNKNFRREAKLLQMVHHPSILQLLEVVETDNSYYLITELCSGGELMKHIYNEKKLGENETRRYMRQMISAVDHLHKAGIIHRDLKVENLLLDSSGNVKIIDFGLSNEEYVMEDSRRVHCSTQCGSPAYAAPELLGHKSYGPEVDIWSLGVNMYAMLTGCLPYTVEPFNITALHAKMLENKMNPIPTSLSQECNDLLRGLLTSDPALRIKMPELMSHPWMTADGSPPLTPHPFPNKLTVNDINEDIIEHMVHVLKLKENEADITTELLTDRACSISAIYYLLLARLNRYTSHRPKVKLRKKSKYDSYGGVENDDTVSTISYRTAKTLRPVTRGCRQAHHVTSEEQEPKSRVRERRNTLPTELLKDDIEKIRQKHLPPVQVTKTGGGTLSRSLRNRLGHDIRPSTQLNAVRPPPTFPTSISHPKDLNKIRDELNRHAAWNSQPPSQASLAGSRSTSRHPSRQPSRNTSASSRHGSSQSKRYSCPEYMCEEIEFHEVESQNVSFSKQMQRKISHPEDNNIHFPSITARNHQRSRSHDSKDPAPLYHHHTRQHTTRTNGHWSPSKHYTFESKRSTHEIIDDLEKVAKTHSISCTDKKANTIYLKNQSTKLQVHIDKDDDMKCVLNFQWLQGGTQEHYEKICSQIFSSLSKYN